MFAKFESYFASEADGLEISYMKVLPEGESCRGIVQIVHGMSEYKERYIPFMEYLAGHGYLAVIHDHRGHGKSVKSREDLGYMYGGGAEALVGDIRTLNRMLHEEYPGVPLILFGHSMGSLAVRAYARKYDTTIDMLIVCGSPCENPARGFGVMIAKMEKKLFGDRHRSRFLEMVSFGSFARKFRKDECTSWICSDPAVAREYEQSEYCGFIFTDDGYLALFELMKEAYDVKHWHPGNQKLPVLFVGGADDPCLGGVKGFSRSVKAMRRAGYVDVKGKLYPHMRHEILNEKEKEKVYRDLVVYIRKKGF